MADKTIYEPPGHRRTNEDRLDDLLRRAALDGKPMPPSVNCWPSTFSSFKNNAAMPTKNIAVAQ